MVPNLAEVSATPPKSRLNATVVIVLRIVQTANWSVGRSAAPHSGRARSTMKLTIGPVAADVIRRMRLKI
jgi:hypothetical protein